MQYYSFITVNSSENKNMMLILTFSITYLDSKVIYSAFDAHIFSLCNIYKTHFRFKYLLEFHFSFYSKKKYVQNVYKQFICLNTIIEVKTSDLLTVIYLVCDHSLYVLLQILF